MTHVAMVWPLAVRGLRCSWPRHVLMGGILALAVAAYLLYATFLSGAAQEARLIVRAADLPCDLVFLGSRPLSEEEVAGIAGRSGVLACEPARVSWYLTAAGCLRVVSLSAESKIWSRLVGPDGRGQASLVPAAGEIILPSSAPGLQGIEEGGEFVLSPPRAAAFRTRYLVAGMHDTADDFLGRCAFTVLPAPGASPNAVFVWTATAGAAAALARTLELDYMRPVRPVLRTMDAPVIWTRDFPEQMALTVLGRTYLPAAGAMAMVFAFCGIGLFTAVTLGFLDRKRNLAILKTVGLESGGLVVMLAVEQGLVLLTGLVLGTAVAAGLVSRLGAYFPGQPSLALGSVVQGALAGALVLGMAIYIPAASAKVATVCQLLYNLPVPLRTQRVSGRTGV